MVVLVAYSVVVDTPPCPPPPSCRPFSTFRCFSAEAKSPTKVDMRINRMIEAAASSFSRLVSLRGGCSSDAKRDCCSVS